MKTMLLIAILSSIIYANPYFEHKERAQEYANKKYKEMEAILDFLWNPERDAATLQKNEAAKPKTVEQCRIYAFKTRWCAAAYPKEKQMYNDEVTCEAVAAGCIVAGDSTYCKIYEQHKCARFVKEPK